MKRPTAAHRFEHLAFRAAAAAGTLLGAGGRAAAGRLVGRIGYRLGVRRELAERHLRLAFPGESEEWIRSTAAAAYAHLGREALEMLRMAALDRDAVLRATRFAEGEAALREAVAAGKGVVLVTGHLGNWEIGGAALAARGMPIDVVAQRQRNPLFDATIVAARERLGMRVIDRREAPRRALRSLRAGRLVAFVADQNGGRAGVFVPFFGRPASTHRGPALLALRTGAPIFLGTSLRDGDGWTLTVAEVEASRAGEVEEAVRRLTAAYTARLEEAVRAAPGQYFWLHDRWKTRPPEERAGGTAVE